MGQKGSRRQRRGCRNRRGRGRRGGNADAYRVPVPLLSPRRRQRDGEGGGLAARSSTGPRLGSGIGTRARRGAKRMRGGGGVRGCLRLAAHHRPWRAPYPPLGGGGGTRQWGVAWRFGAAGRGGWPEVAARGGGERREWSRERVRPHTVLVTLWVAAAPKGV